MGRFAMSIVTGALACGVERAVPDAGPPGPDTNRCPARIVLGGDCDLTALTCPWEGLTCECRAKTWLCYTPDGG